MSSIVSDATRTTAEGKPGRYELVLSERQAVIVLFLMLTVTGLVATMAYIAGRSVSAVQFQQLGRAEPPKSLYVQPAPQEIAPQPPPVLAEPMPEPVKAAPPPVEPPSPSAASQDPSPAAPASTPLALPAVEPAVPPPGQYLQVGSVDRGVAEAFYEYLLKRGFPVHIAPGTSGNVFRVLVGPVAGARQAAETQQALTQAGFASFLRRY